MLELEMPNDETLEIELDNDLPNLNRFKDIKGNPRDNQALAQELDNTKDNAVQEAEEWVAQQGYRNQQQIEDTINDKTYDKQTIDSKLDEVEGQIPTKTSDLINDSNFATETFVNEGLEDKVDKVEGMGLSANDYTNADKSKLASLENYDDTEIKQDIEDLQDSKVDKVSGKGLSTNDFTNAEKTKLASLENYDDTEIKEDLSNLEVRVGSNEAGIDTINSKIQSQASPTNKLTTEDFVNSTVATSTAYFQGTFSLEDLGLEYGATHLEIETALESVVGVKTNNDYVFVSIENPTTELIEKYEKYKFTSDDNSWNFEYVLNNSTFTAVQWSAINSGISALLVAQITNNQNAITQLNTSLTELATRVGNNESAITSIQSAITTLQSDLTTLASEVIKGVKLNGNEITKGTDGKVNIPVASSSSYGVVKTSGGYGTQNDNGFLAAQSKTYQEYKSLYATLFIGKTTLENVLDNETPRIDKAQSLTDTQKAQVLSNIGGASASDLANKMDKANPTGTGALSINRKSGTTATNYSVAIGQNNQAASTVWGPIAIGKDCNATGRYMSVAIGNQCNVSGSYGATGIGHNCVVSGNSSIGIAYNCTIDKPFGYAFGRGVVVESERQTVLGSYNIADANGVYAFIIGDGGDINNKNNIEATTHTGDKKIKGNLYVNCNDDSSGGTPLGNLSFLNYETSSVYDLSPNETFNPTIIGTPTSVSSADNTIATVSLSSGVITITGVAQGHTKITITKSSGSSVIDVYVKEE